MSEENEKTIEENLANDLSVTSLNLESEMQNCYLDYAMSVIIGRALPDVRDGLKPVHRRTLFSMYELNNFYNKPYLKSARIVGDTIGKYHPHGDAAVYQSIVRMAQPFSMRYTLIDGQGNFGSIDGDSAAAMRYTEVRMKKITSDLLVDLEKSTVDFVPNYDDKMIEPSVLPTKIPNLIINGSQGIAVGMATHIPPHNLTETIDATIKIINNPEITINEIMLILKGPDFPTAGFICGRSGIKEAYFRGRGVVKIRAKAEIEIGDKEKERIIISEIPYLVNKSNLILQIAELVKQKRIDGITDIRDESDLKGIRVVVDIKKSISAQVVLNNLYKYTSLQSSFGIILLALSNNMPKIFNIKELLEQFVLHRKEVVVRRTRYDLDVAQEKAHILDGLKKAVENIDAVIATIKEAKNPEQAKIELQQQYELSEKQAQAILDMRLHRLTGLERDKIIEDFDSVIKVIEELRSILNSDDKIKQIIIDELEEIKNNYGDERRTQIIDDSADMAIEDIISDDQMIITKTHKGYIKRSPVATYKSQRRGGRGIIGMSTREEDFVETIFSASNHTSLLIFTNKGKCFNLKVHQIPEASRTAKGTAIVNLLNLVDDERPMTVLPVKDFKEGSYVILNTSRGVIKKMDLMHFKKVMKKGIIAIRLSEEELISAKLIEQEQQEIFIGTHNGQSIRFKQNDLRDMGRTARGVRGINLGDKDFVVGSEVLDPTTENATILTITEKGYGKRTKLEDYRIQGRGGSGIKTIAVNDKIGTVVSMKQVIDNDDIIIITSAGNIIRMNAKDISVQGRNTQGVRLVRLETNDYVAGVARIEMDDESKKEDM